MGGNNRITLPRLSVGSLILLIALSMCLGFAAVFCHSVVEGSGWLDASLVALLPHIVLWSLIAAVVLVAALAAYDWVHCRLSVLAHNSKDGLDCILLRRSKKSISAHASVMLLLWLPWLLASYPASMNWDTYYQIAMWMGETPVWVIPWAPTGSIVDNAFSDHHPFFDTVVYGIFAQIGQSVSGNWNLGVFCFVLFQSAGMSFILTSALAYLSSKGCQKASFAAYLFFCLMPFVPAWAATMVKDSFFTVFYIPYFVLLFVVVESKGSCLADRKLAVALVVLSLLLCLTKKTGPYVVIPTALVFMVLYRREALVFCLQALLCAALMWVALPKVVFPAFDVIPGGVQESLSTCFQQTARCAIDYPDDVTNQEKDAIDAVIGYSDMVEHYSWYETDPVKFGYRYQDVTRGDLVEYLSVWVAQGLRHPDSYFMATASVVANYFSN